MTLGTVTVDHLLDVEVMVIGSIMVVAIPMDEEGADLRPTEEEEEEGGAGHRLEDRSEDHHLRGLDMWTMLNHEEAMIGQGTPAVRRDATMHRGPGRRHHRKSIEDPPSVQEEMEETDTQGMLLVEDLITMNDPLIDTMLGNEEPHHQTTTGMVTDRDEGLSVNDPFLNSEDVKLTMLKEDEKPNWLRKKPLDADGFISCRYGQFDSFVDTNTHHKLISNLFVEIPINYILPLITPLFDCEKKERERKKE